jgi:hypothetical protein
MKTCKMLFVLLGVATSLWACSNDTNSDVSVTGGATAKGGSSSTSATSASGGKSVGGTSAVTVGGTHASGGVTSQASGGASATGGVSAATGGNSAIGGATTAMGGASSAAGGSVTATGGAPVATGGVSAATGGVAATTGGAAAGGNTSLVGGASSTGGTSPDAGTTDDGGTSLTVDEACDAICAVASGSAGLKCPSNTIATTTCATLCKGYISDPSNNTHALAYYETMITCIGEHLTTLNDYQCAAAGSLNPWSPVENNSCEDAVCAWTCYEGDNSPAPGCDSDVYTRCNCQ